MTLRKLYRMAVAGGDASQIIVASLVVGTAPAEVETKLLYDRGNNNAFSGSRKLHLVLKVFDGTTEKPMKLCIKGKRPQLHLQANANNVLFLKNVTFNFKKCILIAYAGAQVSTSGGLEDAQRLKRQFVVATAAFGAAAVAGVKTRTPLVPLGRPDNRAAIALLSRTPVSSYPDRVELTADVTLATVTVEQNDGGGPLERETDHVCGSGHCNGIANKSEL